MPARWSSNAATLKWARGIYRKWAVESVTYFEPHSRRSHDAWGWQDIQVLDGLPGLLAIQSCGTDIGEHKNKMAGLIRPDKLPDDPKKRAEAEEAAALLAHRVREWLIAGNRILVVAWREVWVRKTERHKVKQRQPRFLEAVLTPHPPGGSLGMSDREVEWIEHQEWPPKGVAR